jgi:hypothetical protein
MFLAGSIFFSNFESISRHSTTQDKTNIWPFSCKLDVAISAQVLEWTTKSLMPILRKHKVKDLQQILWLWMLFDIG